jgi:hypothetical protein
MKRSRSVQSDLHEGLQPEPDTGCIHDNSLLDDATGIEPRQTPRQGGCGQADAFGEFGIVQACILQKTGDDPSIDPVQVDVFGFHSRSLISGIAQISIARDGYLAIRVQLTPPPARNPQRLCADLLISLIHLHNRSSPKVSDVRKARLTAQ